jgi:cell division protease FtsH
MISATSHTALTSRVARRALARNVQKIRSSLLGVPKLPVRGSPVGSAKEMSRDLATELAQNLPAAALASLIVSLSAAGMASAADFAPPTTTTAEPQVMTQTPQTMEFMGEAPLVAPDIKTEYVLPETPQWRYSEFISAVENGKVERVRFSKDGTQLQLTAVNGRRATVVLPNDSELVDILAKNGVDISVSEGDQQGNYVALLGNILFPLIAFAGLFFLFRKTDGSADTTTG